MRAIVVALMSPLLFAQQAAQPPRFGASTSLVRLEVNVTDEHGPVRALRAEDFIVIDNGVRQTVVVEETADVPLDLVLVVPPLPAVVLIAEDQAARVSAGISAMFRHIEARDRASVFLAGAPPSQLRGFEFGPPEIEPALLGSGADAAPYDAIAAGLRDLATPTPGRRRALVAFTNAADARSTVSFDTLIQAVPRAELPLVLFSTLVRVSQTASAVALKPGGQRIGDRVTAHITGYVFPARVQQLAKRTGGVAVNLGDGSPDALVADTMRWLRTRYVLSYTPPLGKGWHQVGVTVKRRGVLVNARDGYWVE